MLGTVGFFHYAKTSKITQTPKSSVKFNQLKMLQVLNFLILHQQKHALNFQASNKTLFACFCFHQLYPTCPAMSSAGSENFHCVTTGMLYYWFHFVFNCLIPHCLWARVRRCWFFPVLLKLQKLQNHLSNQLQKCSDFKIS